VTRMALPVVFMVVLPPEPIVGWLISVGKQAPEDSYLPKESEEFVGKKVGKSIVKLMPHRSEKVLEPGERQLE
jgi:hypothetical protein